MQDRVSRGGYPEFTATLAFTTGLASVVLSLLDPRGFYGTILNRVLEARNRKIVLLPFLSGLLLSSSLLIFILTAVFMSYTILESMEPRLFMESLPRVLMESASITGECLSRLLVDVVVISLIVSGIRGNFYAVLNGALLVRFSSVGPLALGIGIRLLWTEANPISASVLHAPPSLRWLLTHWITGSPYILLGSILLLISYALTAYGLRVTLKVNTSSATVAVIIALVIQALLALFLGLKQGLC